MPKRKAMIELRRERPPFLNQAGRWWKWDVATAAGTEAAGWTQGSRQDAERSAYQALDRLHRIERCEVPSFVISPESTDRFNRQEVGI